MQSIATINEKEADAPGAYQAPENHPVMIMKSDQEDSFVDKHPVAVVIGGLIALAGLGYLGQRMWKHHRENSEQKKTLDEDDPASYAQRIKMAFENDNWGGTNMEELRRIFRDIPSKEFKAKIDVSYAKLFDKKILDADLKSELQTTQYNEIMAILSAKPDRVGKKGEAVPVATHYEQWSKRLKAAFDKTYGFLPGTDEDAIKAVLLEIPTQAAFAQVALYYKKEYGNNLLDDLKSELEVWELPEYASMITSKPKA